MVTSVEISKFYLLPFVSNILLLTLDQKILYLILIPTHNQLVLKLEVDPL